MLKSQSENESITKSKSEKKKYIYIVTPALLVETRQIGSQQCDIKCKLLTMTRGKLNDNNLTYETKKKKKKKD